MSHQNQNFHNDASDPPPPYQDHDFGLSPSDKLQEIIQKYEISQLFSDKLNILSSFRITFIFDDSGSMQTQLNESPLNHGLYKATRWDELQHFAKISIEIANVFNASGVDVHFLNRPYVKNVKSINDLRNSFEKQPNGYTPLTQVLNDVLVNYRNLEDKTNLLIIIVTDGEPTTSTGQVDINGFKQCLKQRDSSTYTTIISCTDQDHTMEYLNNWDKTIPRLDVVDDFRSEKQEIMRAQGSKFQFSFGDYIIKSLIGSIDPEMDRLDELPPFKIDQFWIVVILIGVLFFALANLLSKIT
jgi:hypothetical protein